MGILRRGFLMGHYVFVVVGLFLATIVVLLMASVVHGNIGIPPNLPLQYQGSGNTLQTLLNLSWPAAQGVGSTFTFFAPANSAIKVQLYKHQQAHIQNHTKLSIESCCIMLQ
jgi:hypothetical protein